MNHRWDYDKEHHIPGCESKDGNDRTEKPCLICSVIKVTVHPPQGYPWNEWRSSDGKYIAESRPPCVAREVSAL